MEQRHCGETNPSTVKRFISLWNPKHHYRITKPTPCLYPKRHKFSLRPAHTPIHPFSWRSILMLSSHFRLGPPSGSLPSCLPTKSQYPPFLSPIRAPSIDLITRKICGEEHQSWSSSLCSGFQSPLPTSLLGPKYLPQHAVFQYPRCRADEPMVLVPKMACGKASLARGIHSCPSFVL